MDNQNPHHPGTNRTTDPQTVEPPTHTLTATNPQNKPKLNLTDSEAQTLLVLNNLQDNQQPKTKLPIKLIIAAVTLITILLIAIFLLGAFKPGGASKSSNSAGGLGLPNQSSPNTSSGVSNQVNQDVKACSNPLNAVTVC